MDKIINHYTGDVLMGGMSLNEVLESHKAWVRALENGRTSAELHQAKDKSCCRADLDYADLKGVNLRNADLRGAYLPHANLSGADLYSADLRSANLKWANLSDANLNMAQMTRDSMVGVKFNPKIRKEDALFGVYWGKWTLARGIP